MGRRRGDGILGKVGMVIELGCRRPLGVGEASLAEEPLSMWLIVDGEGLARYLVW